MGENRLEVSHPQTISTVKRRIEKEIWEAFQSSSPVTSTLDSLQYSFACQDYTRRLEQLGLVHNQKVRDAFAYRISVAVALLLGVAVIKIFIALSRGRTNVLFLIILAIVACFVATRVNSPFRTASGEKFLQSIRSLFSNLRLRASMLRPGGASSDLTWLAAAFGKEKRTLQTLPASRSIVRGRTDQSEQMRAPAGRLQEVEESLLPQLEDQTVQKRKVWQPQF